MGKQFVDPKWLELIDRAWHDREGVRFGIKIGQRADIALLHETLEFIKNAVSRMDTFEVRAGYKASTIKGNPLAGEWDGLTNQGGIDLMIAGVMSIRR